MKKLIAILFVFAVFAQGAFGQTVPNVAGFAAGGTKSGDVERHDDRVIYRINSELGWALISYYSPYIIDNRPPEADTILPKNNPRLADQKLGAAVFQEMQMLRFLGDTAALGRHEAVLQWIIKRGNVTRAEIEAFYRKGIPVLVSEIVDEQYAEVKNINSSIGIQVVVSASSLASVRNPRQSRGFTI